MNNKIIRFYEIIRVLVHILYLSCNEGYMLNTMCIGNWRVLFIYDNTT